MKQIFRLLLMVFVALSSVQLTYAQFTATGKVTDENGEALIGATVLLKGTTTGTVTDLDGNFQLDLPSNEGTLIFSYTGYSSQEFAINSVQPKLDVVLEPSASQLSEVVVVGYGTRKKGAITGSVSSLESTKLEQVPMTSFEQTLQGNIAGLQSTGIDGAPGANTQIRIRGIGSITASSEPLYVIDGITVQSGDLTELNSNGNRSGNVMASINPNDIESVTVLKDAASTAIYGSRGANGVILITTKSGRAGKARIDFNTQVGFNQVASNNLLQPLNREQYTQLFLEGYTNGGDTPAEAQEKLDSRFQQLTDPLTGRPTDTNWLDAITQTGLNQSYNLSGSGGTDNMKYFFSGSYFDQESHIIGTNFQRFSGRANLEFNITKNITLSNRMSIANTDQNGMVDGSAWANPLYNAYLLSPLIPIRDEQGRFNADHKNYFPMGGNNPVGALSGDDERSTSQVRLMDNISLDVKFLKDFTFRSQWNFDIIQIDEAQYKNQRYGDGRNSGGYTQESNLIDKNWLGTQSLTYSKTLGGNHDITAFVAYEAQKNTRKTLYGYGEEFPNDKLRTLASAAAAYDASATRTEYTFVSLISRLNYAYKSKYFIDASFRRDGSSRFGADNRWGNFYSVGAAWTISNEPFIANMDAISYLKLRSSYGLTGNAAIGNFPSIGLYGFGRDYDGAPGGEPSQIANPALTWESQENFNIGLDFGVFQNVSGTIEYFSRVSSDLILDVPISFTTGFENLTQNFGEMKNAGLELTLNVGIINKEDFTLDVGGNITFLKNELTKFGEPFTDGTKRRVEGEDYQSYFLYGWAGVDQSNGNPLWYTNSSETATTSNINDAERYLIGKSATPDQFGGFNIDVRYKNLSLSTQFAFSAGNYIYDINGQFIHGDGRLTPRSTTVWAFENRWVPGKTDALLPQHQWGDRKGGQTANSSRYLHDGTYGRLRNLTLSYNIPTDLISRLQLRSARVYMRGVNLLTITKEKDLFLDPEQAINGVANGLTPAIKTISFGIDVGL